MFKISNFTNNNDVQIIQECGPFQVIEYQRDLSVMPHHAQTAYFCSEMNIRKRQVICDINKANIVVQAGAMQWMVGNVYATTGFFAVLFITVLIILIVCCHKKPEASSEQSISSAEVPVILPTQDFPITITLEDFPTDSDPFQVSDSYFDALEKDN